MEKIFLPLLIFLSIVSCGQPSGGLQSKLNESNTGSKKEEIDSFLKLIEEKSPDLSKLTSTFFYLIGHDPEGIVQFVDEDSHREKEESYDNIESYFAVSAPELKVKVHDIYYSYDEEFKSHYMNLYLSTNYGGNPEFPIVINVETNSAIEPRIGASVSIYTDDFSQSYNSRSFARLHFKNSFWTFSFKEVIEQSWQEGKLIQFANWTQKDHEDPKNEIFNPALIPFSALYSGNQLNYAESYCNDSADKTKVAYIDTGIDYNHPQLAYKLCGRQQEFVGADIIQNDFLPYDYGLVSLARKVEDHGTAVGSIIATDNEHVQLVPIIMGSNFSKAVEFLQKQSIKIVSLSIAWIMTDPEVELIKNNPNILFVFAAGNEGSDLCRKPPPTGEKLSELALLENVLIVGSINKTNRVSDFSNYCPSVVHIGAVGEEVPIYRPRQSALRHATGTSFAAPTVTRAAALILHQNSDLSAAEIKEKILTEYSTSEPSLSNYFQDGRVLTLTLDNTL